MKLKAKADETIIYSPRVRYMIRLIQLYENGVIPEDMWEDLICLEPAAAFRKEKWPKFTQNSMVVANAVHAATKSSISGDELIFHIFTVGKQATLEK